MSSAPLRLGLALTGLLLPLALACGDKDDTGDGGAGDGGATDGGGGDGGGGDGGGGDGGGSADTGPTWYRDIQPIIAEHCWTCHDGTNDLAFDLTEPTMVAQLADWLLVKMEGDDEPPYLMPPYALDTDDCDPGVPMAFDERLSPQEIETFKAWIEAETPMGDPAQETPYEVTHRELVGDVIIDTDGMDFTTEDGFVGDQYQCWSWKLHNKEGMWLTGARVNVDNANILHHVVMMLDFSDETAPDPEDDPDGDGNGRCHTRTADDQYPDATMLATYVPGADPLLFPEGVAIYVPPDARIVSSTHYFANGTGQHDATSLSAAFSHTPPAYEMVTLPLGAADEGDADAREVQDPPFLIPAGAEDHVETWVQRFNNTKQDSVRVWATFAHLHFAGTAMKFSVRHIDEATGQTTEEECLADVPIFDFNWQRTYEYDISDVEALPQVFPGDQWVIECRYNNSETNPILVAGMEAEGMTEFEDMTVGHGAFDEMCVMHAFVLWPYDGRYEEE